MLSTRSLGRLGSMKLRNVALRWASRNESFSAVAVETHFSSSPNSNKFNITTRLSPSAYAATTKQIATYQSSAQPALAQRLDLESSAGAPQTKFSAICARCGFEPSLNCHQCDDAPFMNLGFQMPLNDEHWFPYDSSAGTSFVQ
jgi:hypothetical protein